MALESLVEQFNRDNSKGLEKIEKIVAPSRKAIRNASKLMMKIDPKNVDRVDEFQSQLAGHKAIIADYYYQLVGLVKNKKASYMILLKNKCEEEEKKFVAAASEPEANLAVAPERRLRDQLQGSLEAATEMIRTCRNIKNNDERKYGPTQSEE